MFFYSGISNFAFRFLTVFYFKNKYFPSSCHFILVVDIRDQTAHDIGCQDQNIHWKVGTCISWHLSKSMYLQYVEPIISNAHVRV